MSQDNDPWGKEPKNTGESGFTDILNQLKKTFLGEKEDDNGSNNSSDNGGSNSSGIPPKTIALIVGGLFVAWLASGLYVVQEGFNGVELRFGKHSETTTSGWHWRAPTPIGSVRKLDTESVQTITVGSKDSGKGYGQMLTSDENIIEVSLSVQYKISNPEDFIFKVNNPTQVLKETMISSIREVVGTNNVDYILTNGRAEWPALVKSNLIATLKKFEVGIDVLRVELREAKAPQEVQKAFDDVVRAREDAENSVLTAQGYQNKEVPIARGQAKVITENAEAYKQKIIAKATGEANRFEEVLKSYKVAPQVTRDRMYIEALEDVYKNVNNIIVDTGENAPILYLPVNGSGANSTNSNNMTAPLPPVQQNRQQVVPQKQVYNVVPQTNINTTDTQTKKDRRIR